MRVFLSVMVILLILLLVFAVQNTGSTEVTFLTFSSTVSPLLNILASVVVGLLLGLAVMLPRDSGLLHATIGSTLRRRASTMEIGRHRYLGSRLSSCETAPASRAPRWARSRHTLHM